MTLERVKEIIPSKYLFAKSEEHLVYRFENNYGLALIDWRLLREKKHEVLEAALIKFGDGSYENGYDDWEVVYDNNTFQDVKAIYFEEDLEWVVHEARIKTDTEEGEYDTRKKNYERDRRNN